MGTNAGGAAPAPDAGHTVVTRSVKHAELRVIDRSELKTETTQQRPSSADVINETPTLCCFVACLAESLCFGGGARRTTTDADRARDAAPTGEGEGECESEGEGDEDTRTNATTTAAARGHCRRPSAPPPTTPPRPPRRSAPARLRCDRLADQQACDMHVM